jgi:hypothetical protein
MAESHPGELRIRIVRAYESGEGSYPEIELDSTLARHQSSAGPGFTDRPGRVEPRSKAVALPRS